MLFKDRRHAGELLANSLKKYFKKTHTLVLGLPRGGVVLAHEVAKALHLPLDIVCARKIGAPYNPEFGIGAITDSGENYLDELTIERLEIPQHYIINEMTRQREEAIRRLSTYKKGLPLIDLENKTVILVDDGIATGATMKASIKSIKAKKAKSIVVAVPVASPDALKEIKDQVDEVVCLAAPVFFQAVGQFYEIFDQTSDQEVIDLLDLSAVHK